MTPMIQPARPRRAHRSSRATRLGLATLLCCSLFATAQAMEGPTALAAVASATPQLRIPAGEPQKLVLLPAGRASEPGATSPATARGEGKVAADRPAAFLFRPDTAGLYSIAVSSPQNAARIAIYRGGATTAEVGTSPTDGAIRWSSDIAGGESVTIVVYTAGAEIPFRVEASGGPSGI